jgi:F0F1-type ATP synthase membrane subunit b/b'
MLQILGSLGIDETIFIQMGIFLVVFVAMKTILFDAYFAAHHTRKERTVGQTEAAERYINEARELEAQYAVQAQQINEQFRTIFDKSRTDANKEYERITEAARSQAKQWMEQARAKVGRELAETRSQLTGDIPAVSQLITAKLLGKDAR